ncbi:MAG: endonuclease III domain-containing protein [Gemmatimonadaceae bacterium]
MKRSPRLKGLIQTLRGQHGEVSPPPAKGAFQLVVWEKVAYLATDDRRESAFRRLARDVGLTPKAVLAAKRSAVIDALASGGIEAPERANNLIAAAEIAAADFHGSLDAACALPIPEAMRALKRIRGIADPGAEKILLLTRSYPVLGVDSNGLRVLTRLGYGVAAKTYGATYKSATTAALAELGTDIDVVTEAHLLLRRHGQAICKSTTPKCGACSIRAKCPSALRTT